MNILKKEIIDALFIKAVELSKNPELLNNGLIMTSSNAADIIGNEYFTIRRDDSINDVVALGNTFPVIHVNLINFKELNEITRVYVIVFCGFLYYTSFFDILFFSSHKKEADQKTIKLLNNNGLLNYESVKELLNSLREVFCKYSDNVRISKRMRNILNVIPVEYFSKN